MIVGIDCYHDTSAGRRSIGALVASLNQRMSRLVSTKHCAGLVHLFLLYCNFYLFLKVVL